MTAQDIIDRAIQIADFVNCDFFTTDELIAIVQEQLYKVYADLIAINDKYFCERVTLSDGQHEEYEINLSQLPTLYQGQVTHNFYRLEDIYEERNGYREPLHRLSPNAQPTTNGYELFGKNIILYNVKGKVVMTYYYEPPIISASNANIDMPSNVILSYLEYLVAQQLRAKQGADFTQIMASAASLFESYSKSIDRDVHDYETVRNVYHTSFRRYAR